METRDWNELWGIPWEDPRCLHTVTELIELVERIGFLPFFKNEIPGFSVEEMTAVEVWWTGDEEKDPWEWRRFAAKGGRVVYGKFFDNKTGFIAREWFPAFANYRRDGYDFDALWDDEKASARQKKIMDLFEEDRKYYSYEVKALSGYGKDGEKGFDGVMTALQMQTYLCMVDFRQKLNKKGLAYGWHVAVYAKPEHLWGYDDIAEGYKEDPEESRKRIWEKVKEEWPEATEKQLKKMLGRRG